MASGPERFVSDPRYGEEFARARDLLLGHPGRWRVIYHYDGDGIASASSALRALARLGYPAQATALLGVERERMTDLLRATRGPVLVVDTGASWLDLYASHPHPVVILDHHRYPVPASLGEQVALVNPLDWGVDGMSEMCAATLTWLFTIFLDPRNWDNAPWGLSGGIADRQHVGGFRGLNRQLVDEAVRRSLIEPAHGLALYGKDLVDGIVNSIDPFFRGLSGRPDAVRTFLKELGLDEGRPVSALRPEEAARLGAALKDRLTSAGVLPEFVAMVDPPRWTVPSLGLDAEELSNLQNACGRASLPGTGVAIALGDPSALESARAAEHAWRQGILAGLLRLEEGGLNSMGALQWFESPDSTLAGTQAGMAMNYLTDPDRPVFAFSPSADSPTKVSARATARLVARGLDLASACRIAAAEVGGEGGGHRVASGATIPGGSRDAFLAACDREIRGQFAGHAASGSRP
jgi:RecJ-like exonuclease